MFSVSKGLRKGPHMVLPEWIVHVAFFALFAAVAALIVL
jgi:hypothetical protein